MGAWNYIVERIRIEDRGFKTPCWVWTKTLTEKGYGRAAIPGFAGLTRVHRATYQLLVGPIPDGLVIDHLCRVPACCNPDHLEAVTDQENRRRAGQISTDGRCINGHDITLHRNRSGNCRRCANQRRTTPEGRAKYNAYMRAYNARRRERALA